MLLSWPSLSPWMKSQLLWEFAPPWAEISPLSSFSFLSVSVFFPITQTIHLAHPICLLALILSYGSSWTQQAVRLISAINRFTCLTTSKLQQKVSSVKHSILEDWWKASYNLHLTLQCCSAAKHDYDISSFLESCFVRFCFATTCKWKDPHCTGSQGISFFLTPSSKCFRQQGRTDRLVCQSLRSVAQVVQVRVLYVTCLAPSPEVIGHCLVLPAALGPSCAWASRLSCVSGEETGREPRLGLAHLTVVTHL